MNGTPIRILLVDNQVDAREWLAEWLRRHEFKVDTATDSDECIRLVQKAQGDYDVILMDLVLDKGRDGIETMKEIKESYPRIETIIITGFGQAEDGVRAMKAGAYRYVLKPFNKEELVVYIGHAAERRKLISEVSRSKFFETLSALRMAFDLNDILDQIVENISGLFNLTTCTISLLNSDKTRLEVVAERGLGKKVVRCVKDLPDDLKRVLEDYEHLEIQNLDERPDWKGSLHRPDLKSFTLVPLRGKELRLGVITMGRKESAVWSQEDVRLFKGLADQAAIAIENVRLHEENENSVRLLQALDEAALDIAEPLEVEAVLLKTIKGATELLQGSGGAIYLFASTSEDEQLEVKRSYGTPHIAEGTVVDKNKGVVGEVIESRKPFSKSNYSAWHSRQTKLDKLELTAVVGVPITYGEELLGVLAVHDVAQGREFDYSQENILLRFGKHAGAALERAQMLDERRHTNELIEALVSGLDDERLLDRTLELLRDHFKYDYCALLLKDESAHELYIASAINFPMEVRQNTRVEISEEKGITAQAVLRGKTIIVPDVRKEPLYIDGIQEGRSEIAVPLKVGERVIGVLDVESTTVNTFTARDERILTHVATAIAIQVDQAQRIEGARRGMEQSTFLAEFTSNVIAADGLEDKLKIVSQKMLEVSSADFCLVMLLTRDGHNLRVRAAHPEPGATTLKWNPALGELCSILEIENLSEMVLGASHKIFRRGEPFGDRLLQIITSRVSLEQALESVLLVPLKVGARFIGLCILGELPGRVAQTFIEVRIGSAVTLANSAASAINQARGLELERERRKALEHLNTVGSTVTATLKPDVVLNLIDQFSRELLNAEVSTTFMVQRPGWLSLVSNSGSPPGTGKIGLELEIKDGEKTGLTGHIAKVFADGAEDFNKFGEELIDHPAAKSKGPYDHIPSGFCASLMAVPLKRKADEREELIGLIKVENKKDKSGKVNRTHGFNEEDVLTLKMLASFAVTAIQNAEHFAFATALQRVAQVVNSSITDYSEVLQKVLVELRDLIPFDTASIQLREGGVLKVKACQWTDEEEKKNVLQLVFPLIKKFPNDQVMKDKRPLLIPDVRASEYEHFWKEANIYCSGHIRAWLGVPLLYGDKAVGMLSIESNTPSRYTQMHIERAEAFARQVVPAIMNAELYKSAESLMDLVEDITKQLEPETVLKKIAVDATNKEGIIGADIAIIYVYDTERDRFDDHPVHEGELKRPELINPPLNQTSIVYRCIKLNRPHLANDVRDSRILAGRFIEREEIKSAAVFPLVVGEQPVGLMFINYLKPHHFTGHEERVIGLFARHAAIAIQNARQHEILRKEKETATAAARIGRLASTWAHDVNTPTLVIRMDVDTLRSELKDALSRETLEEIYDAARDIAQIIPTNLPTRHEIEKVDLMAVLSEIQKKRHKELSHASVSLQLDLEGAPMIWGNSQWMSWIFDRMINNALRFMPDGGSIIFSGTISNKRLLLDIIDTGPGLSASKRRQLYKGDVIDPRSDGRGWSLVLIKSVLNDFKGDIYYPYKDARGNVFPLDLPLVVDPEV
jgi:GAF domain-containing protein/AmiR/NasT family two-component response regulator